MLPLNIFDRESDFTRLKAGPKRFVELLVECWPMGVPVRSRALWVGQRDGPATPLDPVLRTFYTSGRPPFRVRSRASTGQYLAPWPEILCPVCGPGL